MAFELEKQRQEKFEEKRNIRKMLKPTHSYNIHVNEEDNNDFEYVVGSDDDDNDE